MRLLESNSIVALLLVTLCLRPLCAAQTFTILWFILKLEGPKNENVSRLSGNQAGRAFLAAFQSDEDSER